jgi:DtxR family Mn-dependent transcriptional regulator
MREALRIVRRHRVLETYLTERLGFSWEEVHEEAERLEHTASDRLIEAMAAALGDPTHDPHGAPIPTRSGEIEPPALETLAEVLPLESRRIQAVRDEEAEELRTMEAVGLVPGARVEVLRRLPDGSAEIRVGGPDGEVVPIDTALAERVFVRPAE